MFQRVNTLMVNGITQQHLSPWISDFLKIKICVPFLFRAFITPRLSRRNKNCGADNLKAPLNNNFMVMYIDYLKISYGELDRLCKARCV